MEGVFRACFVYLLLLMIFRISGKRTLAQITTFDLVLTLIISEAIQEALLDNDHSLTNALVVVTTLVGLDVLLSIFKQRSERIAKLIESSPVVVMEEGQTIKDRMREERVDESDILEAARELQGIARLDQIRYAVVERNGRITIVPKQTLPAPRASAS